jgi:hypothetical protein
MRSSNEEELHVHKEERDKAGALAAVFLNMKTILLNDAKYL